MMRQLKREIVDTYRFFFKTSRKDKEIVVYAEHGGDWPFLKGIVRELVEKSRKTISYITSDPEDPIFDFRDPRILPFYSRAFAPFFTAFLNAKVCLMTVSDLNHLAIRRSANPVHYIYVMHTLVSTFRTYRSNALDAYDAIYCAGPHHVAEIRKREEQAKLKPKILVEQGYFRLEEVYQQFQEFQKKQKTNASPTVLVAPSWGEKNILESHGQELIRVLLKAGYDVIVRPHPETVRRMPELIESLRNTFDSEKGFTLEDSIAGINSLLKADVLICDMSGVALEYAFGTERPVLFIDVPLKVINKDYQELGLEPVELTLRPLLGPSIAPADVGQMGEMVQRLISEREHYRKKLRELREKYVFNFGNSSRVGAEYILSKLAQK